MMLRRRYRIGAGRKTLRRREVRRTARRPERLATLRLLIIFVNPFLSVLGVYVCIQHTHTPIHFLFTQVRS